MAAYIEAGQVSFVYKDFVLNSHRPGAQYAAEAVQCAADQGAYWAYHGYMFTHQKQFTKTDLKGFAKDLGLDTKAFNQCFDAGKYTDAVNASTKEAVNLKLQGTPTFFINGKMVDLNAFAQNTKALIDAELKK